MVRNHKIVVKLEQRAKRRERADKRFNAKYPNFERAVKNLFVPAFSDFIKNKKAIYLK